MTIRAIELIPDDCLTDLGNGEVTATVGAHPDLHRDDGSPAQPGDVLSIQEDGAYQTRPAGTDGSFERAVVTGAGLIYRPRGIGGRAYLVGLASDYPNK